MRIVYAGTPEFAVPALAALLGSRHDVVGVLTQPDRPKGRGQQIALSPVKQAAQTHGVPVSQPQTLKNEDDRAVLVAWKPDVIVVVAYGIILPKAVLALPRLGCVNIHASLLPRWRGAAPIQRAILAGDRETGVTIMLMDSGLDTGPILLEHRVAIDPTETAGTLHDRLAAIGAPALLRALDGLESGAIHAEPQPAEGMTYASKIDKAEAVVDWRLSAEEVVRKVRAFDPWPVAESRLDGEQLRIYAAHVAPIVSVAPLASIARSAPAAPIAPMASAAPEDARQDAAVIPGTIVAISENGVIVSCGHGSVALTEIQRPGRRRISARDFANTQQLVGRRFE